MPLSEPLPLNITIRRHPVYSSSIVNTFIVNYKKNNVFTMIIILMPESRLMLDIDRSQSFPRLKILCFPFQTVWMIIRMKVAENLVVRPSAHFISLPTLHLRYALLMILKNF